MTRHEQMKAVAIERADTYGLLSMLYSAPPTNAIMDMIRAGSMTNNNKQNSLGSATNELRAFFRDRESVENLENEITAEHTRLFVLPSGVIPHESFYLDKKKRLGGQYTVKVSRYYEDAGAQLTKECLDLPDHIGVELEFMEFLCDLEVQFWDEHNNQGIQKCLNFQKNFLNDHLLLWYRPFSEKVIAAAKLDLYRALAKLTVEFLDSERKLVPEITQEVNS